MIRDTLSIKMYIMRKIFSILIICICFIQCELLEGDWAIYILNKSDHDIVFAIDVDIIDGEFYPRDSYYDPSDNFLTEGRVFPKNMEKSREYIYVPYQSVHMDTGDPISVYAVHPDTLRKYSWEEIKQTRNYWFARVIIPNHDRALLFPFELNEDLLIE